MNKLTLSLIIIVILQFLYIIMNNYSHISSPREGNQKEESTEASNKNLSQENIIKNQNNKYSKTKRKNSRTTTKLSTKEISTRKT